MIKVANILPLANKLNASGKQTTINKVIRTGTDEFIRSATQTPQVAKTSGTGCSIPGISEPVLSDKKVSDSLKRLNSLLKRYARRMQRENQYDPQKLDMILTNYMGKGKELVFYANPKEGIYQGRKRLFTAPDGKQYILEAHDSTKYGFTVRLSQVSDSAGKKFSDNECIYLGVIDGKFTFEPNKHYNKLFHLPPTENVLEWIRGGKCKMGNN